MRPNPELLLRGQRYSWYNHYKRYQILLNLPNNVYFVRNVLKFTYPTNILHYYTSSTHIIGAATNYAIYDLKSRNIARRDL